jgi:hypothetical protein
MSEASFGQTTSIRKHRCRASKYTGTTLIPSTITKINFIPIQTQPELYSIISPCYNSLFYFGVSKSRLESSNTHISEQACLRCPSLAGFPPGADSSRSLRKLRGLAEPNQNSATRTRIFVSLEHALHHAIRVPEVDSAVLRPRDDPLRVAREADRQHIVLQIPASVIAS